MEKRSKAPKLGDSRYSNYQVVLHHNATRAAGAAEAASDCLNARRPDDQTPLVYRFCSNSIYRDLPKLKDQFGEFTLFTSNGINDYDGWINNLIGYLKYSYDSPDDFIQYFQGFLDRNYQNWFFGLDDSKKANLTVLKTEFLSKSVCFERDQHELCDLKKDAFLEKIKSELSKEVADQPLVTYFQQKLLCHSKAMPKLAKLTTLVRIIFQLGDPELIDRFYPMRCDSIKTILSRAQFEDKLKKG